MRHCEHVKANGHFCGSPALRDRNYCFFHLNRIGQQLRATKRAPGGGPLPLELPVLDDAASVQLALMQVTDALLRGTLDPKRAGLVLYALQTASMNLRNMAEQARDEHTQRAAICNRYDSFEQDYELDESDGLRVDERAMEAAARAQAEALKHDTATAGSEREPAPEHEPQPAAEEAGNSSEKLDDSDTMRLIDEAQILGLFSPQCFPTSGSAAEADPVRVSDRDYENSRVRIPLSLSQVQYHQARQAVAEYQSKHGIDAEHPEGRPPVAQHAAGSQKLFVTRKPPQPYQWPEEEQQLATNN